MLQILTGAQARILIQIGFGFCANFLWFLTPIGLKFNLVGLLWLHNGPCKSKVDAKVIVGLLNSKKNPNSTYAPLLIDCRNLLDKLPEVRVVHVFREANKCADWLAKWGCSMSEDFAVFDFPFTAELETLVVKDINGLYYCRLVAASIASVAV